MRLILVHLQSDEYSELVQDFAISFMSSSEEGDLPLEALDSSYLDKEKLECVGADPGWVSSSSYLVLALSHHYFVVAL